MINEKPKRKRKNVTTTTMKYNLAVLMVLVMILVGCSKDDFPAAEQQDGQLAGDIITLGVKDVMAPITKAQHTGSMDFTQLDA